MSYYADDLLTLELGDCVEVMRELPADSVDAVVTDPPYLIGFMGKSWDSFGAAAHQGGEYEPSAWRPHAPNAKAVNGYMGDGKRGTTIAESAKSNRQQQAWHEAWGREAFRVAKPGAHLLAFGGTRTYHRLASAIEDAGWEIRDCLVWAYASGFPKSLDVSKAIDRAAGAERERIGDNPNARDTHGTNPISLQSSPDSKTNGVTAPATPDAAKWDGWGTALKPAWEPIVMARKPLRGTVAANVLAHGTGAINVDGTRIPTSEDLGVQPASRAPNAILGKLDYNANEEWRQHAAGRWPANLLLTDPIFDGGVPGVVGGGAQESTAQPGAWQPRGAFPIDNPNPTIYGDAGTYSRFFLVPKSSRSDREPLLRGHGLPEAIVDIAGQNTPQGRAGRGVTSEYKARANSHPTVKPLDLMRHLVRLVTPPGGTVLDPFLGSGTTAIAANAEGFRAIGIEREQEYLDIAVARLAHQEIGLGLDVAAPVRPKSKAKGHWPKERTPGKDGWGFSGQTGLEERVDEVPA